MQCMKWKVVWHNTNASICVQIVLCVRAKTLVPSSGKRGCMLEVLSRLMMIYHPPWKYTSSSLSSVYKKITIIDLTLWMLSCLAAQGWYTHYSLRGWGDFHTNTKGVPVKNSERNPNKISRYWLVGVAWNVLHS